tara:strand:- start:171 stop:452 length:282 start_codon:yes stop_codon:yes gene_type:complete
MLAIFGDFKTYAPTKFTAASRTDFASSVNRKLTAFPMSEWYIKLWSALMMFASDLTAGFLKLADSLPVREITQPKSIGRTCAESKELSGIMLV